jgi:hypothetical protein
LTTATIPTMTLSNGVEMPAFGLGVFQSPPEETTSAVEAAIANGYPLVDTAAAYGNEREVGEAICRARIDRSQFFIVTKLWISDYGYDEALVGFDGCLRRLGVDYVDLFLLHHPVPTEFDRTVGAYRAIEEMLAADRTRAIGVANFMEDHLENLLGRVDVVPEVNQIEVHPYFSQPGPAPPDGGARCRDPGLVADRRRLRLRPQEHLCPRGPRRRRAGGKARQDACTDRPALAHRAWLLRDPEIGQAAPHRREHRHLRLPAHTRRGRRHRRPRHRRPRRPRPGEHQPGHVPVQGRERLMTTWTSDELTAIGNAEELTLASVRRNGTLRRPVTMWVVRAGDDVYVRSVNGRGSAWFRSAQDRHEARIRAGGVEKDVELIETVDARDTVDAAYHSKYARRYPSIVPSIVAPEAQAATLKLVPEED